MILSLGQSNDISPFPAHNHGRNIIKCGHRSVQLNMEPYVDCQFCKKKLSILLIKTTILIGTFHV